MGKSSSNMDRARKHKELEKAKKAQKAQRRDSKDKMEDWKLLPVEKWSEARQKRHKVGMYSLDLLDKKEE